jgi:hypothetical protein
MQDTEIVLAGHEVPGNRPWDSVWNSLAAGTLALTDALLVDYERVWDRPGPRPVEPLHMILHKRRVCRPGEAQEPGRFNRNDRERSGPEGTTGAVIPMPQRVAKSLFRKKQSGYPHHEHRSKRARKKNYHSLRRRRYLKSVRETKRAKYDVQRARKRLLNKTFKTPAPGSKPFRSKSG